MAAEDVDSRPVPDPTTLTTVALDRAIRDLGALFDEKLRGLRELVGEKFGNVERRFNDVESGRVEQKRDYQDKLDAALTASKELVGEQAAARTLAIDKAEASTIRQLDQLEKTVQGIHKELSDKLEAAAKATDQRIHAMEQRIAELAAVTG